MFRVTKKEPSVKSHLFRLALALGQIGDGLVGLLSLGCLSSGFALALSLKLAQSRFPK